MMQNIPVNGNGHTSLTSPTPSSDPVEAATILKVYYSDLLTQADRAVAEIEAELAKVRAKRDAAQVLADQAALMLERVQEFQKIETGAEFSALSPSPTPYSYPDISEEDDPPLADADIFVEPVQRQVENFVEEQAVVITEDDLPPVAKVVIHDDGSVDAEMLPRFNGMKKIDAITQILQENGDRVMHRSSIAQELFGHVEDKEARRIVIGRVGAALTSGKGRGLWFSDPRNEGFYTSNKNLIKGNKKSPR